MTEPKVTFAPAERVDDYEDVAREMLDKVFGVKAFVITDLSTLSDFMLCCWPDDIPMPNEVDHEEFLNACEEEMARRLYSEYKIMAHPADLIVDVCERIARNDKIVLH